jgi:hypothetical protein
MLGALRTGSLGISLQVPNLRLLRNDENFAELAGPDGVVYHLFYFPDLHMVFRPGLEEVMARHARRLFDEAFVNNGGKGQKRTDDPEWSPLVEVESLDLGAPALRSVHRMLYQHGREMTMGHLLVPLAEGLFETRVIAMDQQTGFRESVLLIQRQVKGFLSQKEYDDPAADAMFPMHSLSRVRAALRAVCSWDLKVLRPALPSSGGERVLPQLRCALVPPTGFVPSAGQLTRTSFSGTDGRETFLVERHDTRVEDLRGAAEKESRSIHQEAGVTSISLHLEERAGRVVVIVEGDGHQGRVRNALHWFSDASGRLCHLAIISSLAAPIEILTAELEGAASSFRLT